MKRSRVKQPQVKHMSWAALTVLVLASALPAGASTFLAMSPAELTSQSDAVVTGEVIQVESFRDSSGRIIVSQAMIQVDEVVTGEAPTVVMVETFGGTVGDYTVVAHGFPQFDQGDRLLVFLDHQEDGTSRVVGYRLGQYRVILNRLGEEIAVPTLEKNVTLLTPEGAAAERPQAVKLEVFKRQLREQGRLLLQDQGF